MTIEKELEYLQSFMTDNRKAGIEKVLNERTKHFTVVIEDIFKAHNASAVVRTCDVFGIQQMYATQRLHELTISSHVAKGSDKWVDIDVFKEKGIDNTQTAIDEMKKKGYQIVATSPHYGSTSPTDFDISKPAAIFFGAEKEGLSKNIIDQADAFIKIPMYGFTESLNISVSVAIILQNLVDRLKNTNIEWKLSEEEKLALRYKWSKSSVKNPDQLLERYYLDNNK